MCRICRAAAEDSEYVSLLGQMLEDDGARLEATGNFLEKLPSLSSRLYTSLKLPKRLSKPLFEAKAAFAVPHNYFQHLFLDSGRAGNHFSHGATRSVFFSGDRLVLLSKGVGQEAGKPFFTSFLFVHFEPGEYAFAYDGKNLKLSVDVEKPLRNLLSGKVEKKRIGFSFYHQDLSGKIITKEQAAQSSYVKKIYGAHGDVRVHFRSADLVGYVVSVSHFAPHPFLTRHPEAFGFGSPRDFQEHALDYFVEHLRLKRGVPSSSAPAAP